MFKEEVLVLELVLPIPTNPLSAPFAQVVVCGHSAKSGPGCLWTKEEVFGPKMVPVHKNAASSTAYTTKMKHIMSNQLKDELRALEVKPGKNCLIDLCQAVCLL
jgi:hypothetical protein